MTDHRQMQQQYRDVPEVSDAKCTCFKEWNNLTKIKNIINLSEQNI
jgi:hypothetical protein